MPTNLSNLLGGVYTGPAGNSGFSGVAGTSGYSGYSGTGDSGYSGYSGEKGNPYRVTSINYSSPVTFNVATNNVVDITLTGNVTIGFSGGVDAQPVTLRLRQDSTGGRTITFDSSVRLSDSIGTSVTLSTAPNALDYINFRYNSTDNKYDLLAYNLGF